MELMDVDTVIDEAIAAQETPETAEVENEQPAAEEPVEEETTEEAPEETEEVTEDPFPKKAVNAIARRDKQNNKLKAQNQELLARLEALEKRQPVENNPGKDAENKAPVEDDYETYGEFLRAEMKYQLSEELGQRDKANQEQYTNAQQEKWVNDSRAKIADQYKEQVGKIADLAEVWQENADLLDELPPHIEMAFYEADNAPLAIYTLAKEGKLEALATMSPIQAAMVIGQAQMRAENVVAAPKPTSNAPAPMASAKGTGSTSKTIDQMGVEDLLKWAK